MTIAALILISILGAVIYLMNRIEHGVIYYYHGAVRALKNGYVAPLMVPVLKWWDRATFLNIEGIHKSGHTMHGALGVLVFIAALGWTGTNWKGVVASGLLSFEYYLLADALGQRFINAGSDDYSDKPKWWQPALGVVILVFCLGLAGGGCS